MDRLASFYKKVWLQIALLVVALPFLGIGLYTLLNVLLVHTEPLNGCDVTLTESGVVTSPNFPSDYPSNSRCLYTLKSRHFIFWALSLPTTVTNATAASARRATRTATTTSATRKTSSRPPTTTPVSNMMQRVTPDVNGWTVFQRRTNWDENFTRTWPDYKHGFGDPEGDYWLGNDQLHQLTSGPRCELRVELKFKDKVVHNKINQLYVHYYGVQVMSEEYSYRLKVNSFDTNIQGGEMSWFSDGVDFSTYDFWFFFTDPLEAEPECDWSAFPGGWWRTECDHDQVGVPWSYGVDHGLIGSHVVGDYGHLFSIEMKVRDEMTTLKPST